MSRRHDVEMALPLLVTVDTNQFDTTRIERIRTAIRVPFELACISVTTRERSEMALIGDLLSIPESIVWGESRWGEGVWGSPIPELLLLDESHLGHAVHGEDGHVSVFETALRVISAGSFPPPGSRESLTAGQRRQLRDAMIFEAHTRARRHVLVTADAKGFINDGRRETLEALGRTRILTPHELEALPRLVQQAMAT
jgi:hypothetical protein